MTRTDFNWKIAGYAGQGIKGAGEMFSKLMVRYGWDVVDYTEYPSLIKGGHNTYQVYCHQTKANSMVWPVDVLVCLNKNGLVFHKDELTQDSLIVVDLQTERVDPSSLDLPGQIVDVPFAKLAKDAGGSAIVGNTAAMGAVVRLLGLELETLKGLIADTFAGKKPEITEINQKAAQLAYEYVDQLQVNKWELEKKEHDGRISLSGNEAVGLGAIAGGLQFYVAYPMSPSTSILHYLASQAEAAKIVVKHAEDEIGVANMALGASFAGVRTMVGTSGGGWTYMTEALGMSGVAELPLVMVEAQRPGPALGMPTWSSQADLLFVINASHDEFPRIVLAPGDPTEAFEAGRQALGLAETYQLPVIILSAKDLAEGRGTLKLDSTEFSHQRVGVVSDPQADETGFFPRYYPTDSGISYRTVPGTPGGNHIASSYEHDRYGFTTEDGAVRNEQMDKRFRKFETIKKAIPAQAEERVDGASIGLISWGTAKGPTLAAREILSSEGLKTSSLNLSWMWPFPVGQVSDFIAAHEKIIVIENNKTGQLAKLIAQETGKNELLRVNKYDGRPFWPHELAEAIKQR
jgi:2-oxoglutarate ferredoxin oxidoreductase subunit alpha